MSGNDESCAVPKQRRGLRDRFGGAPPGTYYLIAEDEGSLEPEWIEEESGHLADTDWLVWRVALPARAELKQLGLHITGGSPPEIEFSGRKHHPFGATVFEFALPPVLIRNWDEANASRHWIVVDNGSRSYPIEVAVGQKSASVQVPCPSAGEVKVEPRGLVRQESALSVLPFTVIPSGINVSSSKQFYMGNESARMRCAVPSGWRVVWQGQEQRSSWDVPARETTVDGVVSNGAFQVRFSLRMPRISVSVIGDENICWKDSGVQRIHVQGPSQLKFEAVLVGDGSPYTLTSIQTVARNGTDRIEASHFKDSLRTCPLGAGEFAIRLTDGALVRSGYYYASPERIQEELAAAPVSSVMFKLPGIGAVLVSVRDLLREPITSFEWNPPETPDSLKTWFAAMAYCAHTFDKTTISYNPEPYAERSVADICKWYARASKHIETRASSKEVLETLPAEWLQLPVERWRADVQRTMDRLQSQIEARQLVREWRAAIQRRDGSATSTKLGQRTGGAELSEGARQYFVAVRMDSLKTRNQSLNKAICELENCRAITNCPVIRGTAAALLSLAYTHSGRLNMLSADLKKEHERAGLDESDVSPLEKDYGNTEFASAGAMAANRISVSD